MEIPSSLHSGQVLSGSEWGNMLVWEAGYIKVELCRTTSKTCHQGPINQIMLDEGEVITVGSDGCIRVSFLHTWTAVQIIQLVLSDFISHKGHFMKEISGYFLPGQLILNNASVVVNIWNLVQINLQHLSTEIFWRDLLLFWLYCWNHGFRKWKPMLANHKQRTQMALQNSSY